MFKMTITSQGQVTVPAEVRRRMGVKAGDKLNLTIRENVVVVSKATGWETLRGVLSEFKGNYPTQKQLAKAHVSGLKMQKNEKNTGRHQHFAQVFG